MRTPRLNNSDFTTIGSCLLLLLLMALTSPKANLTNQHVVDEQTVSTTALVIASQDS